jgi:hypothetical protein
MKLRHLIAFLLAPILIMVAEPPVSEAQIRDGATMTVLRGEVAIGQAGRESLRGAPSGTLVRVGDEVHVYGPTDESVVGIVCLDDCTSRTTFAGCPMAPNLGYWVEVDRGQVVSACQPFTAGGDPWGAPAQLRLSERR